MSNKLTVPARLKPAAEELKNNMKILFGCSPEVKEVIALANNQKVLMLYGNLNRKWPQESSTLQSYYAYCLPDDIEIVGEDDKPQVPEWVSKKYTVCEVQNQEDERFKVTYPNGYWHNCDGLPAALRCEGWIFKGWLHEGCELLTAIPFGYVNDNGEISINNAIWYESSIAYASVWQKAGEK